MRQPIRMEVEGLPPEEEILKKRKEAGGKQWRQLGPLRVVQTWVTVGQKLSRHLCESCFLTCKMGTIKYHLLPWRRRRK